MPKLKIKNESGLSEFVRRPMPTKKELESFEKIVSDKENFSSESEEEIDESLSEIYHDDKGNMVDVQKLNVMKKRGFVFWFFSSIFILAVFGSLAYGAYYYIFHANSESPVSIAIDAESPVLSGEEFFYDITYKNSGNVSVSKVSVEVKYPENFVFLDSSPQKDSVQKDNNNENVSSKHLSNSTWEIGSIKAGESGHIKIKGKLIGEKGASNILMASINYTPENFSSEFKKEIVFSSEIKDTGLDLSFDSPSSVLIGAENEISVSIKPQADNYQNDFKLSFDPLENLELISVLSEPDKNSESKEALTIGKNSATSYDISGIKDSEQELKIKYKFTRKINSQENLILRFARQAEDGESYVFHEEQVSQEIMKNDLNLTLIINGSKNDQGIGFGETLNYSLNYINKGEEEMKDVAIMAVLDGDSLDWRSLTDSHNGKVNANSIIWTKEEIPELAVLTQGQEGVIDFSIKVAPYNENDLGKDFAVKSYAQFSIGNINENNSVSEDNKSNTINSKLNSDLSLKEEIRYFSADNVPVGSGPLPPRSNEATSFKVYWKLTNNIHELNDTKVETILPSYVSWDGKNRASVGNVSYDQMNNKVTWTIGRWPTSVYRADAEFSISITPNSNDINKILILTTGSTAQAIDTETQTNVESQTKAKTTKLEDDDIAGMSNDGRVQ